jgi:hypothetical protein
MGASIDESRAMKKDINKPSCLFHGAWKILPKKQILLNNYQAVFYTLN